MLVPKEECIGYRLDRVLFQTILIRPQTRGSMWLWIFVRTTVRLRMPRKRESRVWVVLRIIVCSLILCEMWTYLVLEGNNERNRPGILVLESLLSYAPWTLMVGWLWDVLSFITVYYMSSFLWKPSREGWGIYKWTKLLNWLWKGNLSASSGGNFNKFKRYWWQKTMGGI